MMKETTPKKRVTGSKVILYSLLATLLSFYFISQFWPKSSPADPEQHPKSAQGQFEVCQTHLQKIASAFEQYARDHGGEYPVNQYQLVPDYLKSLPECPTAGLVSYRSSFGRGAGYTPDPSTFLIVCAGEYHSSVGCSGRFPAFDKHLGILTEEPTSEGNP
jgi:hypothetical protein